MDVQDEVRTTIQRWESEGRLNDIIAGAMTAAVAPEITSQLAKNSKVFNDFSTKPDGLITNLDSGHNFLDNRH